MPRENEADEKRTRRANGESSIYEDEKGYWHGRVTVGIKDNGKPDRRHVGGKTRAAVVARVKKLERQRDEGKVQKAGQRWTVETWLTHWIENIAVPPAISDNTHDGYAVDVRNHLIPGLGGHKLVKLSPDHLDKFYRKLVADKKMSAGGVDHVHRTLRLALNVAIRRGLLFPPNPANLAAARPKVEEFEVDPYEVEDIQRILDKAAEGRNGARWVIALALGLRQGEALGLKWEHVDFKAGTLKVRRNRLRPKYEHGCGGGCGKKAGWCPKRVRKNGDTKTPKSKAGRRVVDMPDELVELLKEHKVTQEGEQLRARRSWHEEGWVFADEFGRALNPSTDYHAWKRLLSDAVVREARLHDARHTAATVLLVLGVPPRVVMEIMGWSSSKMAERYQHVTSAMRRKVAGQVGALLWGTAEAGEKDAPNDGERQ